MTMSTSSDQLKLAGKLLKLVPSQTSTALAQRLRAAQHRWTYRETSAAKNVVVLGGSFAGVQLVQRLSESLPTGYRVVMIEKNSHFNFLFAFPRFSVLQGHERRAFIPYDGIAKDAVKGIYQHLKGTATHVTEDQVHLASGEKVDYAYLAVATGTSAMLPAKVASTEIEGGCSELRSVQENIKTANKIAVVGGGAVGVELASDIKSFYPEKDVTLVHSRQQLLPSFGMRLHEYVVTFFKNLGINMILGERPQIDIGGQEKFLRFPSGRAELFDLIIPCTGQRPNSNILNSLSPTSISPTTSRILVSATLQITSSTSTSPKFPNIFAMGDIAETRAPKMGRAAQSQAAVVTANILSLIKSTTPTRTYKPVIVFEGAIKLTLGKHHVVLYTRDTDGSEILVAQDDGKEDFGIENAWRHYGVEERASL